MRRSSVYCIDLEISRRACADPVALERRFCRRQNGLASRATMIGMPEFIVVAGLKIKELELFPIGIAIRLFEEQMSVAFHNKISL